MNISIKKTTVATCTTSWDTGLVDENGVNYATISGKVDSTRPFGSVTLTVHNQSVFNANKEAAKAAYEAFESAFDAFIETINPLNVTEEVEALTV